MERERQIVSRRRVADHGEVLTGRREVEAMLDLVKRETERIESRFLEPACGTGNFLVAILERKIAAVERKLVRAETRLKKAEKRAGWKAALFEPDSLLALGSIYGIDILQDSLEIAKSRLFSLYKDAYRRIVEAEPPTDVLAAARFILDRNILLGDAIHTHDEVSMQGVPGLDQIVFTEWSRIGDEFKRREFRFDAMPMDGRAVDEEDARDGQLELFPNDEPAHGVFKTDSGASVFKPLPIREHPPTHYRNLAKRKGA